MLRGKAHAENLVKHRWLWLVMAMAQQEHTQKEGHVLNLLVSPRPARVGPEELKLIVDNLNDEPRLKGMVTTHDNTQGRGRVTTRVCVFLGVTAASHQMEELHGTHLANRP